MRISPREVATFQFPRRFSTRTSLTTQQPTELPTNGADERSLTITGDRICFRSPSAWGTEQMKHASTVGLGLITLGCLAAVAWAPAETAPAVGAASGHHVTLWEPLLSGHYAWYEKIALCLNVVVAIAGLYYAWMLVGQVRDSDQGTPRMQDIARAIRDGANAYLYRQFRVVGILIVLITVALYFAAQSSGAAPEITWGRSIAFLVGSLFSATVGFV